MAGSASPYQPEPDGADGSYYERQQAIARLRSQIDSGMN